MITNPQTHDDRSEGPKFLRAVAEEMRGLADRDPNIALELCQMADDLESTAVKILEHTA